MPLYTARIVLDIRFSQDAIIRAADEHEVRIAIQVLIDQGIYTVPTFLAGQFEYLDIYIQRIEETDNGNV
jgi:hypothetical protein